MRLSIASCCLISLLAGCATVEPTVVSSPETYLKEADRHYAAGRYDEAIGQWKKFRESDSPADQIAAVELKIADTQYQNEHYIEAAVTYEEFRKLHPNHEKAAYALYRIGLSNFQQITGIDTDQTPVKTAFQNFESFLRQYPDSTYAPDARAKLEQCRTKMIQHEIYVGRFYYRTDKYQAAIKRLEEALKSYPSSPVHDELYFYLGTSYYMSGNSAKGREVLTRLTTEFPASPLAKDAAAFMEKNR